MSAAICGKCGQEICGQIFYVYSNNPWPSAEEREPKLRCGTCHSLDVEAMLRPTVEELAGLRAENARLSGLLVSGEAVREVIPQIAILLAENARLDAKRTLLDAANKRLRALVEEANIRLEYLASVPGLEFIDWRRGWITRARAELAGASEPSQPAISS